MYNMRTYPIEAGAVGNLCILRLVFGEVHSGEKKIEEETLAVQIQYAFRLLREQKRDAGLGGRAPRVQAVQNVQASAFLHHNIVSLFITFSLHFISLDRLSIIFIHLTDM
jgi:hypothetical protein